MDYSKWTKKWYDDYGIKDIFPSINKKYLTDEERKKSGKELKLHNKLAEEHKARRKNTEEKEK